MKKHSQIFGLSASSILFAVFTWSLLILRFGYRFGTGDQVELLPYTLFLHNSSLYPYDFFIQGLNAAVPNERTVMATLLLPFVNHLETSCFVLHLFSTLLLVLGLEKLAARFVSNVFLVRLSILVTLIFLNDFTLGNVELYSDCFQAGGLATAVAVWAINLFLDKKYPFASLLISLATFIQLLDGLTVMMVLSAIFFLSLFKKQVSVKSFLYFIGIYFFTAGVYLIAILLKKSSPGNISNQEVFNILFEFRHPHHFIFSAFPKIKILAFLMLSAVSVYFYRTKSKTLFYFTFLSLISVIVYAFSVDVLHQIFIGNFQFYKITQWTKFFGVVACFGLIEKLIKANSNFMNHFKFEAPLLVISSLLCWVVILNFNAHLPYKVPFQLFSLKNKDSMISICKEIKKRTSEDAVFIQPFDNTELKFYSERSSYVEFKANVRHKNFVRDWHRRIEFVYGVSVNNKEKGFELQKKADDYFYHYSNEKLKQLKQEGVTHLLTKKEFPPSSGSLILQNDTYAVYQL